MLFQRDHIELIRRGEKTQTRRDWSDSYAGPTIGSIQMATPADLGPIVSDEECDCYICITDRWEEQLGALSAADADAEGNYTVSEFCDEWRSINDEWDPTLVVDVVEFEYIGRSRPE